MASERRNAVLELVTVCGLCAFLFFYGLGSFGLLGADEPRYAQIAREMLARHDWITPVLNGTAWLEKPVLYYWSAMVSYSIFGVHDWAARVPTAVMTTLLVLASWVFMRRFRRGSQLDTALILATMVGVVGFARAASTDMPLAVTFSLALMDWYQWHETRQKRYLCSFYVLLALGTLAKGPVAPFLAALIVVAFILIRRDWKLIPGTLWIPGILIYFVIALPWFVLVQRANPQFVHVFIFEHNLARFGTNMFRHKQPFWYYVPVLFVALLPWLIFALAAVGRAIREYKTSSFQLYFGLWAILPVIFFSFSQSKLPGYILPSVPAFAILLGEYLWRRLDESQEPELSSIMLHSLVVGGLFGTSLLTVYFVLGIKPTAQAIVIALAGGALCCGVMVATIYGKGLRMLAVTTAVPLVLAMAFVLKFATPAIDARDSARPIAAELAEVSGARVPAKVAIFGVPRDIEYGLNFYENAPIANYDRGEIPAGDHLLVAKAGSGSALRLMLGNRASKLGAFAPRKIEFYRIAAR